MFNNAPFASSPRENDIFISYSARDTEFVQKLDAAIRKRHRDPWIDWEDIPKVGADRWRYVEAGLRDAELFVFVISPDSVTADENLKELNLAQEYNKQIVPVLWQEIGDNTSLSTLLPDRSHWIKVQGEDIHSIEHLADQIFRIDTNVRLLVRAKIWDTNQRNDNLLLYGRDLAAVRKWCESSEQNLELLQREYLKFSIAVEAKRPKPQPEVFISYSRRDKAFVARLLEQLKEQGREYGLTFWIDWENIPVASEWEQEIYKGIEDAHTFLFILSPYSVVSKYCCDEIAHAVTRGKRLVPIVRPHEPELDPEEYQDIEANPYIPNLLNQVDTQVVRKVIEKLENLPANLRKLSHSSTPVSQYQVLSFVQPNQVEQFDQNINQLVETITTDLDAVKYHTELDNQTYQWLNSGRDREYLLSGKKLRTAQQFLLQCKAGKFKQQITLTDLLQQYIEISSRVHRNKWIRFGVIVAIAISGTSALFIGWIAAEQGRIREMVSSLEGVQELDALIRASRAGDRLQQWGWILDRLEPDLRIRVVTALQQEVSSLRERNRLTDPSLKGRIFNVRYSPDSQFLASASKGRVELWTANGELINDPSLITPKDVWNVVFDPGILVTTEQNTKFTHQVFAAAGENGDVRLWQIVSELDQPGISARDGSPRVEPIGTLSSSGNSKENPVISIAFSPSGVMIAAAKQNGTIDLWIRQEESPEQWKRVQPLTLKQNDLSKSVNSISFSPDGKKLAAAGGDGKIKIWTLDKVKSLTSASALGQPIELEHGEQPVLSVSFSPNGKLLASASVDGTVRLWKADGTPIVNQGQHEGVVYQVMFSPDGQILASAGQDDIVRLWDVTSSKLLRHKLPGQQGNALRGHQGDVYRVLFSQDSRTLITASEDDTIKLWAWREGRLLETLEGHRGEVLGIDIASDGKEFASASTDRSVRLWNLENRVQVLPHNNRVNDIAFHPDGYAIASSGFESVKLWNKNGKQLDESGSVKSRSKSSEFQPVGEVSSVEFSPDGQLLAAAGADGKLRFWAFDRQKNQLIEQFLITSNPLITSSPKLLVSSIRFSPIDRQIIASADANGTIRIWRLENKRLKQVQALQHGTRVNSISFSSDGKWLASAGDEARFGRTIGTIKLWQVSTTAFESRIESKPTQSWNANQVRVLSISFSYQQNEEEIKLASAGVDGSVKLWTLQDSLIKPLNNQDANAAHESEVNSVSFSPNGKLLASASEDGTIKLWTAQGNLITTLRRHQRGVNSVRFSPDGKTLASAGKDADVYLWELPDFSADQGLPNTLLNGLLREGCTLVKDYIQSKPQENQAEVEELNRECERRILPDVN